MFRYTFTYHPAKQLALLTCYVLALAVYLGFVWLFYSSSKDQSAPALAFWMLIAFPLACIPLGIGKQFCQNYICCENCKWVCGLMDLEYRQGQCPQCRARRQFMVPTLQSEKDAFAFLSGTTTRPSTSA